MTPEQSAFSTPKGIAVGDALPPLDLPLSATRIVAGAIASRDFMPVHHDRDYAQGQGAPDIFMNILTSNGCVSRFVTDWAGPEAALRSIKIVEMCLRLELHTVMATLPPESFVA